MKLTFLGRSNLNLIYRIKNAICSLTWVWEKKEENEHKVRQLLTYMAPRLQLIYAYCKQN